MKDLILRLVLLAGVGLSLIALWHGLHGVLNLNQYNCFWQSWNLAWLCRIPLLPIKVSYSAVCLKDSFYTGHSVVLGI